VVKKKKFKQIYSSCMMAKVGRETVHQPTIGKYSLHERRNENGRRLVYFAAGRQMAIKSTYFMQKRIHMHKWHSPNGQTCNQIDHCLIDGTHFSSVKDVMGRRNDHMLVVIKLEQENGVPATQSRYN
jgi:hypothetical protein